MLLAPSDNRFPLFLKFLRVSDASINPGYEKFDRALSYEMTQEHVVPRRELLQRGLALATLRREHAIARVFDIGCGPGVLFEALTSVATRLHDLHYVAVDLSLAMIVIAAERIARVLEELGPRIDGTAEVRAYAGINALAVSGPDMREACGDHRYDLVVASQFEQYCPNSRESPLAQELSAAGAAFVTKTEFRQFARSLLEKEGLYMTVQDYSEPTAEAEQCSLLAWDEYASAALHNFIASAAATQLLHLPRLYNKLMTNYGPGTLAAARIEAAATARERRRSLCREETQLWSESLSDLEDTFGKVNISVIPHPLPGLSRFRLVLAQVR